MKATSDPVYFTGHDRRQFSDMVALGRQAFSLVTGPPQPHFSPLYLAAPHGSYLSDPCGHRLVAPGFIESLFQRRKGIQLEEAEEGL